jgi:tRNA uridine 5-carboxymethylaminomethyl modification enzyme
VASRLNTGLQHPISSEITAEKLLMRSEVNYTQLISIPELGSGVTDPSIQNQIEIQAKYSGYIQQQQKTIDKKARYEKIRIPPTINYQLIPSLSNEVREKLEACRPITVGQASRIPGMTPAAISILLIYLKRGIST